MWILLCLTRLLEIVNRSVQTEHSNGFSPVWIRLCIINAPLLLKPFPHSVQLYLELWTFICNIKYLWVGKRFSHWLHEYSLSSVWVCLCWFKYHFLVNRLLHTVHKYGFDLSPWSRSVISLLAASVFTSKQLSPNTHNKWTHNSDKKRSWILGRGVYSWRTNCIVG